MTRACLRTTRRKNKVPKVPSTASPVIAPSAASSRPGVHQGARCSSVMAEESASRRRKPSTHSGQRHRVGGGEFANAREFQVVPGNQVRVWRGSMRQDRLEYDAIVAALKNRLILDAAAAQQIRLNAHQFHLQQRAIHRFKFHCQRLRRRATRQAGHLDGPQHRAERRDRTVAFDADPRAGRQAPGHHRLDSYAAAAIAQVESLRIVLGDDALHAHQVVLTEIFTK